MPDILIYEDHEMDELFSIVNEEKIFFHPKYSINGEIDYKRFLKLKRKIVILDRNLVSYLLEYAKNGILKSEECMVIIALTMLYCKTNYMQISVGFALQEYSWATGKKKDEMLDELNKLLTIINEYPAMIWKKVLYSNVKKIPKLSKVNDYYRSFDFSYKDINQMSHECEMIALARIYKSSKSKKDKLIEFIEWIHKNVWICQYTIVYAIILFGGLPGVKAPKNINSKNFDEVVKGCINQACDLSYLSKWSMMYWNEGEEKCNYFFATNDELLKVIFFCTHRKENILNELYNLKEREEIINKIEELQNNRVKPNIDKKILEKLFEEEKEKLRICFKDKEEIK